MVGEELHRDDEHARRAARGYLREELDQVGSQPFLPGVARALVRETPVLGPKSRGARDRLRGAPQLLDVFGLGVVHPPRHAVGGQQDGRTVQTLERVAQQRRDELEERGLQMPAADHPPAQPANRRGVAERALVAAHEHVRPLRRQHDAHELIDLDRELMCDALDARLREAHRRAHAVAGAELALERRSLRLGDADERRTADRAVAPRHFRDELRRRLAAAAYAREVRGQLALVARRAVRHEQHADGHAAVSSRTSATTRRSVSGSVPGSTP